VPRPENWYVYSSIGNRDKGSCLANIQLHRFAKAIEKPTIGKQRESDQWRVAKLSPKARHIDDDATTAVLTVCDTIGSGEFSSRIFDQVTNVAGFLLCFLPSIRSHHSLPAVLQSAIWNPTQILDPAFSF
jgi:hypothetical protein